MKNKRIFAFLGVLISLIAGYTYYWGNYNYSEKQSKPKIVPFTSKGSDPKTGMSGDVNLSIEVYNEFEELIAKSDSIVIGYSKGENGKSRNLFRDVSDPSKESTDDKAMTKEFDFKVEKWLKGSGPGIINLAIEDYSFSTEMPNIKFEGPAVFPNKEKRSLLFLKTNKIDESYYYPASPIYLFEINDNKKLNPLVKKQLKVSIDKPKDYDEEKLEKLVENLKSYKRDKK